MAAPRGFRSARALSAAVLVASLLALPPSGANAQSVTGAKARTTLTNVVGHRFPNGDPGGLGYEINHEVLHDMEPGEEFPPLRIDAAQHPEGFAGQWADEGFHSAWVAPKGEFQYNPWAATVESAYFDNYVLEDGAPLQAGDSIDIAVKQLSADTPLTWSRRRQAARGEMGWEVATQSHVVGATYGDVSGSMEVLYVRADLVARGGDVDARGGLRLPPLVVDLPRSYGPEVRGSAVASQFAPYLHYISGIEGEVLPQSGKAVFTANTRGYIPEAKEYTLPGGAHIREWHIPLNIVISLTTSSSPLDGTVAAHLPSGGVVWEMAAGERAHRIDVPSGAAVLSSSGLEPRILPTQAATAHRPSTSEAEDEPAGVAASAASGGDQLADIFATAPIDRTLSEPVRVTVAKRSFSLTIDPDVEGRGFLGIRAFKHTRTGQGFYELAAVPYVRVNGEPIALDRSRLVDLRVEPVAEYIAIGFTSRNDGSAFDQYSTGRQRMGRIKRTGIYLEAVYDLGDDRYAFVSAFGRQEAGSNGSSVDTAVVVRSFTGAAAEVSGVHYMELSEPGPITYAGEARATEFSGNSAEIRMAQGRVLGGATGGGFFTVVRGGSPLTEAPTADPSISIDGAPVGVYVTSRAAPTNGWYSSVLISWLTDVPLVARHEVPPIDESCVDPPIVDGDDDTAPHLDVERSWFGFDGANLYSTIQVARLDEEAIGSPVTFRASWRFEHIGFGAQAQRNAAGEWTYSMGLHSSAGASWNPIPSVPVKGELQFGSPGFIRLSHPVDVQFTGSGFLDGEILRDTGVASFDGSQLLGSGPADRAPSGAPESAFGHGGDFEIAPCPGSVLPTILELTERSATTGQHTDTIAVEAALTDASGSPVAGETVSFRLADAEVSAVTDADGIATADIALTMAPGDHQLVASFAGTDSFEPSQSSRALIVEREDTSLQLSVTGNGSKRRLHATLTDEDTPLSGIQGRTISFYADGELLGSASTDDRGIATVDVPPRYRGARQSYEASFDGDAFFLPSIAGAASN